MSIKAKIGIIWIPFRFSPTDACGNYGFNCPVNADQDVELKFTLPVLRKYPRIKTQIKLEIADENKNSIVCIQFPAKLQ